MSMDNCSFDVVDVSVMFQSSLQEASLFTQLSNMSTIIVGDHLISQDGICNLVFY